jgi:hypothetical protein
MRGSRDSGIERTVRPGLARFTGSVLTDPAAFAGGADRATIARRRDTVAYGYLSVVDEYVQPDTGARWRVLTTTLSGRVPHLIVDHRSALGRPGIAPPGSLGVPTNDPQFDAAYIVHAESPAIVARVLSPAVRKLLLDLPIQRFALVDKAVSLRTFDASTFSDGVDDRLAALAGSILASTPSFVSTGLWPDAAAPSGEWDTPLPPGRYGKDELTDDDLEREGSGWVTTTLFVLAGIFVAVAAVVVLVLV